MGVKPTYTEMKRMSAEELMTWLIEAGAIKQHNEWEAEPVFVPADN
jgi:hypothetical protein